MPSLSFAILVVILGSCLESLCLLNAGCVVLDRCDVSLENHLEEHHYIQLNIVLKRRDSSKKTELSKTEVVEVKHYIQLNTGLNREDSKYCESRKKARVQRR